MKNLPVFIFTLLSIGLMSFILLDPINQDGQSQPPSNNEIEIPDDVQAVLNRSCLPCHDEGGSTKARVKWKYEKMTEYSKSKLVSKYIKIFEKVDEGKMPPEKDVKKHPERAISAAEKELLKTWAEKEAVKLTGE